MTIWDVSGESWKYMEGQKEVYQRIALTFHVNSYNWKYICHKSTKIKSRMHAKKIRSGSIYHFKLHTLIFNINL